jgi:N-acetylmuramoyl-L-alanine amidase
MNVKYIGRKWILKDEKKYEADGVTPFRFGSAHVFCDMDSVTEAIPLDEVAWNCGDKNYKRGYQRIAEKVFMFRQNYETIGVEICNNDVIKNSLADWDAAVENAKNWVIEYLKAFNIRVDREGSLNPQNVEQAPPPGTVLLLRHYDITGKLCPKPFVDDPKEWMNFIDAVCLQVG